MDKNVLALFPSVFNALTFCSDLSLPKDCFATKKMPLLQERISLFFTISTILGVDHDFGSFGSLGECNFEFGQK